MYAIAVDKIFELKSLSGSGKIIMIHPQVEIMRYLKTWLLRYPYLLDEKIRLKNLFLNSELLD